MDLSRFSLEGKVALVTGGSRGIGRAVALHLADAGANVAVCARNLADLEQVAAEIEARGVQSLAVTANIRKKEELNSLVDKTLEKLAKIDILVNNVATNVFFGEIVDIEERAWDVIMNTNLKACFLLSQRVGKHMIERKSGVIINVASIAGTKATPFMGTYSISKAALIMLTRVMASEWGKHGIRVNCIAPGVVKTRFSEAIWTNEEIVAHVTQG
ncbi:MAG: SDR family NAD(P)-dependent oxidoreductase, partial [Candidatus Hydrogenedentes bacterium]|nr:SDR family NAD(P)-dependent oxidoreductase [Candidatus Hydrogenedentota bacterium]